MAETIAQAHERLNYAHYEPRLRAVKGLWAQLQKLQRGNPSTYIKALEQHIATLRKREEQDAQLDPDDADRSALDLHEVWSSAYTRILPHTEGRLPSDPLEWMAKWYPDVYAAFDAKREAWRQRQSATTVKAMRQAIIDLFAAYETAV